MNLNFHVLLINYINTRPLNLKEKFLLCINHDLFFRSSADHLINSFNTFDLTQKNKPLNQSEVKIENYAAQNTYVLKMISYLDTYLKQDLAGAYLHGSLGTNDAINYSDFDALAIIKNEVFADKKRLIRVSKLLHQSKKIMLEYDPLQHHGWFVLSEKQLENYPVTFFPPELFNYCKSLLKNQGLSLNLKYNSAETDFKTPFVKLCNAILKSAKRQKIRNVHQLKSLLSEFMLLPALYVQARDKKGIYKKISFDEAKKDFTAQEWKIMADVSELRQNWQYHLPAWKKKLIRSNNYLSHNFAKLFSPSLNTSLIEDLQKNYFPKMIDFTERLLTKIK